MINNKFYQFFDFIFKLLLLNFSYFFSLILGLGIAGFFPATLSLIKTINSINELEYLDILKVFFKMYKNNFILSNLYGYAIGVISVGAFVNFKFLTISQYFFLNVLAISFLLLVCYLGLSLYNSIYFIEQKFNGVKVQLVKGCLYTFTNLPYSLLQLVLFYLYTLVVTFFPVVFLFGGTSLLCYLMNKLFILGIERIENNKSKYLL